MTSVFLARRAHRRQALLLAMAVLFGLASTSVAIETGVPAGATVPTVTSSPIAAGYLRGQSDMEEIKIGQEADRQIEAEFGFYQDEGLQAYVDRVGNKLAEVSERPGLPWTFRILDSPVINAFSVPGGFVYVTRGILAHMNSEAELAGVLGHEIGHVTGRHGAERQKKSTLASLGMLVGSMVSPTFTNYFLRTGLAQNVSGLFLLKFSRGQELDADKRGIRYMTQAGYDPRGIGSFFETLQATEKQSDRDPVPGWLATHPKVDDRIKRSAKLADEQIQQSSTPPEELIEGRTALLFAVDDIIFGDNPREGYMRDDDFLHPDLRFAITFPGGWEVHNGRQAVVVVSPKEDAAIQLTLADAPAGTQPEDYVRSYMSKVHAKVSGSKRVDVNGLRAVEATFQVRGQRGSFGALGLWVLYDERLYELMGMTSPRHLSGYLPAFRDSLHSFRELTDPEVLATQPARVELIRVPQPMQLIGVLESHPEVSVPSSTITVMNHLDPYDSLEAGTLVKLVDGGPKPVPDSEKSR